MWEYRFGNFLKATAADDAYQKTAVSDWGGAGSIPVPTDYDGDNEADICLYQESADLWR